MFQEVYIYVRVSSQRSSPNLLGNEKQYTFPDEKVEESAMCPSQVDIPCLFHATT